jgi:hypothetical protein
VILIRFLQAGGELERVRAPPDRHMSSPREVVVGCPELAVTNGRAQYWSSDFL